ncbi:MAG: hypothetical protein D6807_00170 [Alphaproteobacteria bacterium]|nr:MAG: hypothetical protein D6807_00170 [Alphaproteobacteria bacterium]
MAAFALSAAAVAFLANPAHAQSVESLQAELAQMQAQMAAMQQKMQAMAARLAEAEARQAEAVQAAPAATAEPAKPAGDAIKVKWEPAPSISSPDGRFEMNLRGRVYVDAGFANDDNDTMNVDATELRAARLGIEGKAWQDIKYKFEADFAGNKTTVKDAYIQWHGPLAVTVGQFKTPNSLEEQTSSRYITFMERGSFTDAFDFERQIGLGLSSHGKNWSAKAGLFRGSAGSGDAQEGVTVAGRITFGPKVGAAQLHFGGSFRYRDQAPGETAFRYRQRPHLHLADRLIATDHIADSDVFYGIEAAAIFGSLAVQAEYGWLNADLAAAMPGAKDPTFSGGYVDLSWFFTGEQRAYHPDKGAFGRIKVHHPVFEGGPGAWQLALRYDRIDLSDAGILAGEQESVIAGVNWYLNRHTRVMFNYAHADITKAFAPTAKGDLRGKNNADSFGMRAQVDW